jgi:hypothetical protein
VTDEEMIFEEARKAGRMQERTMSLEYEGLTEN